MDWNYQIDIYIEYSTDKLELMRRSCHNAMLKNKKQCKHKGIMWNFALNLMSNGVDVISQVMTFTFVAKAKRAQHELKKGNVF